VHCGESGRLATNGYDPLVQMINVVNAIDWKSRPAQALGVLVTGSALGLVWILSDLTFSAGIMGWIVFAIVGLPVYVIGEVIWDKAFSMEAGERISKKASSWKRVGYALVLYLSMLLIASVLYFS
jgi:hypothetical protein